MIKRYTPRRGRRNPPVPRNRSGCLTCRRRRKKCNEEKPVCLGCERNCLSCVWPVSNEKTLTTQLRPAPISWSREDAMVGRFLSGLLPSLVHGYAHPVYSSNTHLCALVMQYPVLRNIALACSALNESRSSPQLAMVALQHYSLAVTELKTSIQSGSLNGSEDWLLASTQLASLFEYSKTQKALSLHVTATARLFALRQSHNPGTTSSRAVTAFERLFAEAVVYQGTVGILYGDDPLGVSSNPMRLRPMRKYCLQSVFDDAQPTFESPLLDLPYEFFELASAVSVCYVRKSESMTARGAKRLLSRIHAWEIEYDVHSVPDEMVPQYNERHFRRILYLASAKILVYLCHPEKQDIALREVVRYSFPTLHKIGKSASAPFRSIHAWPCYVIGCAVSTQLERMQILSVLERLRGGIDDMSITRAIDNLDLKWREMPLANSNWPTIPQR